MKIMLIGLAIIAVLLQSYVIYTLYKIKNTLRSIAWFFINLGLLITLIKWSIGIYILSYVSSIDCIEFTYECLTILVAILYAMGFRLLRKDLFRVFTRIRNYKTSSGTDLMSGKKLT